VIGQIPTAVRRRTPFGRSEHAVYTATDGSVELTGMPKVQQG